MCEVPGGWEWRHFQRQKKILVFFTFSFSRMQKHETMTKAALYSFSHVSPHNSWGGGGRGEGGEGGFFKCDARLEWNGNCGAERNLIENRCPDP
jgi:hypothetical protein